MKFYNDDIEVLYEAPDSVIKRGTVIKLFIEIDRELERYYRNNMSSIIDNWLYAKGDKDVRPFRVLEFTALEKGFEAKFRFAKKDAGIDELKLFCKDIVDVFNLDKTHVTKWRYTVVE